MHLDDTTPDMTFTTEEIRDLTAVLGFPRDTLSKAIFSDYDATGISLKEFHKCCDLRYFHQSLNFTFNLKSGGYNTHVLKKSIQLIADGISLKQLQEVRLSFETHEEYDQRGMRIDEPTFIRTLKLCGLVISPQKLMNRVRHLKATYKHKDRIQLYEFLDLLRWCELLSKQQINYEQVKSTEQTERSVYLLDDFKQVITPRHKKVLNLLNQKYQHQELQYGQPKLVSEKFSNNPIPQDTFEYEVRLANEDFANLKKRLKKTSKQVKMSRGGFTNIRAKSAVTSSTSAVQSNKSTTSYASSVAGAKRNKKKGAAASVSMTTISDKTQATVPANFQHKPQKVEIQRRPASCPIYTPQDQTYVKQLKFDIETESQRWSDYFTDEISSHLPNYQEVMKRLVKEPPAPGVKRIYRRERPSKKFVRRLAEPKPMLPNTHLKHCSALTQGMGSDEHAVTLQKHASVVNETRKSKRKPRRKRKQPKGHTSFLHTFLSELDTDDATDSDTESENNDILNENLNDVEKLEHGPFINQGTLQMVESTDSMMNQPAIECVTPAMVKRDKVSEAMDLICGDFSRVYLVPQKLSVRQRMINQSIDESNQQLHHKKKEKSFDPPTSRPVSARSVDSQTTETTAFEQYISDPENLKVSEEYKAKEEEEKTSGLRKSYKRMTRRLSAY
uniref:uncharacterized protein LOC100183110 isoform X3 n=1 Tax=Ciona intestinalis TaxID=7719 RepID=UPI000EF4C8AE|nr:uncharacterized protein LOC100183110 isoform X3 [Ciona intestinalis]|eukprot:XP_026691616.1 uncharacterized protein LOC100183110 isoform X3 [Ciona intestinalis]